MSFLDNLKKAAGNIVEKASQESKDFVFETIPTNLAELMARPEADQKDPFGVAALTVIALNIYPANPEECFKMMEFLNGPNGFSNMDKSFMKDRFSQNGDSTPRSYFRALHDHRENDAAFSRRRRRLHHAVPPVFRSRFHSSDHLPYAALDRKMVPAC